ncbi:MAG: hypothetical protein P5700_23810, partial [Arthrospira platensis PCC 7345]|nr:hypothetical protein [Arthrospira platensis PCC 7345]
MERCIINSFWQKCNGGNWLEICGSADAYGTGMDLETINKVAKKAHREALLKRLRYFGGDPKKAFGGKNSPSKNPIYLDELH